MLDVGGKCKSSNGIVFVTLQVMSARLPSPQNFLKLGDEKSGCPQRQLCVEIMFSASVLNKKQRGRQVYSSMCVLQVCVYVCMYVCVYVCMYVYVICVYVCLCVCVHMHHRHHRFHRIHRNIHHHCRLSSWASNKRSRWLKPFMLKQ